MGCENKSLSPTTPSVREFCSEIEKPRNISWLWQDLGFDLPEDTGAETHRQQRSLQLKESKQSVSWQPCWMLETHIKGKKRLKPMWTTCKQNGGPAPSERAPSRNWNGYLSPQMAYERGSMGKPAWKIRTYVVQSLLFFLEMSFKGGHIKKIGKWCGLKWKVDRMAVRNTKVKNN